jgi:hypothetical protein
MTQQYRLWLTATSVALLAGAVIVQTSPPRRATRDLPLAFADLGNDNVSGTGFGARCTSFNPEVPGNWGGEFGTGAVAAFPTDADPAGYCTFDWHDGGFAHRIELRVLDGIGADGFDVYVENPAGVWTHVYGYDDRTPGETWELHEIHSFPAGKGHGSRLELKIVPKNVPWAGFATWGQLAVDYIAVYADARRGSRQKVDGGHTDHPASLRAASPYFIARSQHRLSPHLEDIDQAFAVGDGLIHRTLLQPTPTPCCSSDRHYITTRRSDYLWLDWTYEITFHSPANGTDEVLFVGFGEAVQDPLFYNEPQNSVYLAISQGASLGSDVRLSAHDAGMWSHTYLQFPGAVRDPEGGAFTVRIRKIGPGVTFDILGTEVAATIPNILEAAPFLSQVPTRIFFGNAFGNYSFSDMRVLPERGARCK